MNLKLIGNTLLAIVASVYTLYSSTLTVTNTNDSGVGSLRDQVSLANATDTIMFDSSLEGSTITLTSGEIAFAKSLTILGPGYDLLTISGNNNSRIFDSNNGDVMMRGLKLINGNVNGSYDGGAIRHQTAGTLTLNNIYFDNNIAITGNGSQGGALFFAVNNGTFVADTCFFMNSQSDNYGGAVSLNGGPASASLNYCWFDGNQATGGPCGGLFTNAESLTVENSTFSNNTADQRANIWLGSGSSTDSYSFTNCTFSHNIAPQFPYQEFGFEAGTLSLINCTFTGNNEPVYVSDYSDDATLLVQNCIFNNTDGNFIIDGSPTITSLGGNVSTDSTLALFATGTNDLIIGNPLLGPLTNNGGLLYTHNLLSGSPAIDNGINSGAPSYDQIGNPRSTIYDAGSVEKLCQPVTGTDVVTSCNPYTWIDGNTYSSSNSIATYNISGGAANGCDSVVTLNLTINHVSDVATTTGGTTITANNTNATYRWMDCTNNYLVISGETGQSFTPTVNGSYAVELSENGCIDTSACVTMSTVGILENNFGANLSVYPNPTHGLFSVDLGNKYESVTVSISDIHGKIIRTLSYKQNKIVSINMEEEAGIYLVSIKTSNKSALIRLVKN